MYCSNDDSELNFYVNIKIFHKLIPSINHTIIRIKVIFVTFIINQPTFVTYTDIIKYHKSCVNMQHESFMQCDHNISLSTGQFKIFVRSNIDRVSNLAASFLYLFISFSHFLLDLNSRHQYSGEENKREGREPSQAEPLKYKIFYENQKSQKSYILVFIHIVT